MVSAKLWVLFGNRGDGDGAQTNITDIKSSAAMSEFIEDFSIWVVKWVPVAH